MFKICLIYGNQVKMKRNPFLLCFLFCCLISCSTEKGKPCKPDIEYDVWGEEIIWNDCAGRVILTIQDLYEGKSLVVDVGSGASVTLMMPGYGFHICLHTAAQVTISGEGFEDVILLPDAPFFNSYSLEERDYYVTIGGNTFLEEMKWPVYTYHITNELLQIGE